MRKKHDKIYASWKHLVATLLMVVFPVVLLFLFSRLAHITTPKLISDILVSLIRMTVAYVIAAVIGWTLAVFFYRGRRAIIALPLFDVLQSFPTFAALPLAVIFWGHSNTTVIVFLVLAIVWPILFTIISSLKLIRHDWEEAVTIAGLKGFNYFKYFIWPICMPALITGSIIGLGDAWEVLIATEIIVNVRSGVGMFFQSFASNATITTFGILSLLALIFTINKLLWLPLLERSHQKLEE